MIQHLMPKDLYDRDEIAFLCWDNKTYLISQLLIDYKLSFTLMRHEYHEIPFETQ